MSYSPTTWETGDTITAEKLNNMEQGIANAGVLVVNITPIPDDENNNDILDKTWQEIHDALLSKGVTFIRHQTDEGYSMYIIETFQQVYYDTMVPDYPYGVTVTDVEYLAATADDYPQSRGHN